MKSNIRGGSSCVVFEEDYKDKQKESKEKEPSKIIIKDLKVKEEKKVHWSEDTVNNENMNLRKSKSKIFK